MGQIKKSYRFLLAFLFNLSLNSAISQQPHAGKINDDMANSVRFKSHLLFDVNDFEATRFLPELEVPIALRTSGGNLENLKSILAKIPREKLPVVVVTPDSRTLQNISSKDIFVVADSELDQVNKIDSEQILKGKKCCKEFLLVELNADSVPSTGALSRFWEDTGKIPNFIKVDCNHIADYILLVAQLNNQPKIFGVIKNGDHLLADVSWKDFPERNTSGYFSFPVDESKNQPFAPYKPGFRFSPDIILPSPENVSNLKVFNALSLEHDFGLTDEFHFSGKVRNVARNNDQEITLYGVTFDRDPQRGDCAQFSGRAYLDGGLKSRGALKPNFSITAWIKPTDLGNNNCILGKGKDFVLKIHQGKLTFTVQGVKDYYSGKTKIPINQWSFIGLVHSSAENLVRFYLNGQLMDEVRLLSPYQASDYTVLIGSNLWEEFFKGYISGIKIWERELNDDEIRQEFASKQSVRGSQNYVWMGGFAVLSLLLIGTGFIVRRRKKQISSGDELKIQESYPAVGKHGGKGESISCFGGLRIVGSDGSDLSKKLSPKLKQLFVLILLHSLGNKKGISSKEMSDVLWPGMSPQNAKNIRGTNIQNLKAVLAMCSGIKLVYQDKLWFFEFADGYFVDYAYIKNWLANERYYDLEKLIGQLPYFLSILKGGLFFQNMSESWLDSYINQMSSRVVEYCESLFHLLPEGKNDTLLLDIAEVISINDPLSEVALRKKMSILTKQGKLGLAHSLFDNFGRLYFELYQEKYRGNFKTLISGN